MNGKSTKIKIGIFKRTDKKSGLTLKEIRDKARDLSAIAVKHGDVKKYLELQREGGLNEQVQHVTHQVRCCYDLLLSPSHC